MIIDKHSTLEKFNDSNLIELCKKNPSLLISNRNIFDYR